jgi:hypothetical protein
MALLNHIFSESTLEPTAPVWRVLIKLGDIRNHAVLGPTRNLSLLFYFCPFYFAR